MTAARTFMTRSTTAMIPRRSIPSCRRLFRVAPPMSAAEQKETFSETLAAALDTDCRFDVVQAVHENLRSRIEEHKEAKDPDALEITARDVVKRAAHERRAGLKRRKNSERECEKRYGTHAALDPNNIVESKKLEIVTPEVKITLPGEFGYLVETREIDRAKIHPHSRRRRRGGKRHRRESRRCRKRNKVIQSYP